MDSCPTFRPKLNHNINPAPWKCTSKSTSTHLLCQQRFPLLAERFFTFTHFFQPTTKLCRILSPYQFLTQWDRLSSTKWSTCTSSTFQHSSSESESVWQWSWISFTLDIQSISSNPLPWYLYSPPLCLKPMTITWKKRKNKWGLIKNLCQWVRKSLIP